MSANSVNNSDSSQQNGTLILSLDSEQALPELNSNWKSQVSLDESESIRKVTQKDAGETVRVSIETNDGTIWIEGNSLFVACPTCAAPLSVRMWLLSADCWQCEEQIQLTREQEEAVDKLLKTRNKKEKPKPAAAPVEPTPAPEPAPTPVRPPRPRCSPLAWSMTGSSPR